MSKPLPDPEKAADEIRRIQAKIWRERPAMSEHEWAVGMVQESRDIAYWPSDAKTWAYTLRVLEAYPKLRMWVENVATDEQLDTPVPSLGNKTGRELLLDVGGGLDE